MPRQVRELTRALDRSGHLDHARALFRARSDSARQMAAAAAARDVYACRCTGREELVSWLRDYADNISLLPFQLGFDGSLELQGPDSGERGPAPDVVRLMSSAGTLVLAVRKDFCTQESGSYYAIDNSELFPALFDSVPNYARGYWTDWRSALLGTADYLWPSDFRRDSPHHEAIRSLIRDLDRTWSRQEPAAPPDVVQMPEAGPPAVNWRQVRRDASVRPELAERSWEPPMGVYTGTAYTWETVRDYGRYTAPPQLSYEQWRRNEEEAAAEYAASQTPTHP